MYRLFTFIKRLLLGRRHTYDFTQTTIGMEFVDSSFGFIEDDTSITIDGKTLIRTPGTLEKAPDGGFAIPNTLSASGLSFFVRYDGVLFVERRMKG